MYRSTHSLFVSQFSRRSVLKGAAAAGAVAVASPAIVSNAFSSSGTLNIINWDDELPNPLIPDFEKATGIKVNSTPFSQNEEQINKLQATGGEGWLIMSDLAEHLGLRAPGELAAMIAGAGLRVLSRMDAAPSPKGVRDSADPLHFARKREVVSLWRLGTSP